MQQATTQSQAKNPRAAWALLLVTSTLTYLVYFVPWTGERIVSFGDHVDAAFCVYEVARGSEVGLRYWEMGDDPMVGIPYPTGGAKHPGLYEGLDFLLIGAMARQWLEPVAAFHFAVGVLLTLNGLIVGWLVHRQSGSLLWSCISAALLVANLPLALRAPVHPNLLKVGYSLLALWSYFALVGRPSAWQGVRLGLAMALVLQGSYYLAYLTAVGIIALFLWDLLFRRIAAWHLFSLLAAGLTFAPLALAIAFPVLRQSAMPLAQVYFQRDIAGVWHYAAELWQYLRPYPSRTPNFNWGGMLFPGYTVLAGFFILGFAWLRRWRLEDAPSAMPRLATIAFAAGVFVTLSLRGGPGVWLFELAPSFRCYDRAGLVAVGLGTAMAGLVGARLMAMANPRAGSAMAIAAMLLTAADVALVPTHFARVERRRERSEGVVGGNGRATPGWAQWLKDQPADVALAAFGELDRGPLLEDHWHWESLYLRVAVHGHRTLNGCDIKWLDADLHQLGASYAAMTPDGLRFVASLGYRHLAFDAGYLAAHPWIVKLDWLEPITTEAGWTILRQRSASVNYPAQGGRALAASLQSNVVKRVPANCWITEALTVTKPCVRTDRTAIRAAWFDATKRMVGRLEPILEQRFHSVDTPTFRAKTPTVAGDYSIELFDESGERLATRLYRVDTALRRVVATAADKTVEARIEAADARDAALTIHNRGNDFVAAKLGPKRSKRQFEPHPGLGDHFTVNTIFATTWTPDSGSAPTRSVHVLPADIEPKSTMRVPVQLPNDGKAGRILVGFEFVGPADWVSYCDSFEHGLTIKGRFIAATKPLPSTGGDHFVSREFGALPLVDGRTFVGDFDGDKIDDIAIFDQTTGHWHVLPTRLPPGVATVWASWSTAVHWSEILVGDFTGDGKADLAALDGAKGVWHVAVSSGKDFHTLPWSATGPNVLADLRAADVDGDGKADILALDVQKSVAISWRSTGKSLEGPRTCAQVAGAAKRQAW